MKTMIEKLPLTEDTSFVARTHCTPRFEVGWHQHEEYELILITQGRGVAYVGNAISNFETGDIFFLGANLPHTFRKSDPEQIASAVVVHFKENFWGSEILDLPESSYIKHLLVHSLLGLKVGEHKKQQLVDRIIALERSTGFRRIINLCECLDILCNQKDATQLSSQQIKANNEQDKNRIEQIFHYAMEHFAEPVKLVKVAAIAGMTPQAFCNYFKKRTKKTYVEMVNEIRIGNACQMLSNTEKSITEICFDSGYLSLAHFNRMFLKLKGLTPSAFRKQFSSLEQ